MTAPALSLQSVRRTFGSVVAVNDLTLDLPVGGVFGLLGPNGAGKTTTIRMICGELTPDSGRILLHGHELRSGPEHRRLVGWCPQELVVFRQLTCTEQLEYLGELYGLRRRDARARGLSLLRELGLDDARDALGAALSGGMQRRLNVALALVHDPQLIVLDEPGAGLDPASRVLVREVIARLAAERTVVLTTHEMDEAERLCTRAAIVDHGRLLAEGAVGELLQTVGGGHRIDLALAPDDVAAAAETLHGTGTVQRASEGLAVVCDEFTTVLPDVLDRLARIDVVPRGLHLRQPGLEDVFLALTSHPASVGTENRS